MDLFKAMFNVPKHQPDHHRWNPHLQLAPLRGEFEGLILRILHPGGGQRQQGADGGLVVDQVDEPGPGGGPLRGPL